MKEKKMEKIGKIIRIVLVILCFGALGYAIYWTEMTKENVRAGKASYHRLYEGGPFSFRGYSGDSLEVNIPEKVRGTEVTRISRFTEKEVPPSGYRVYIPDTVTVIGANAFSGCKDLTITGGINIVKIEENAFKDCSFAEPFPFYSGLTYIGDGAFEQAQGLGEVRLSRNMRHIGEHAFYGADVEQIKLPKQIEYIGEGAFDGTKWLEKQEGSDSRTE